MSFKSRVEATQSYLTASEKKIADFILDHSQIVVQMNISDLARASQTSTATISRLVKSLQIESYTAMKVVLSSDLASKKTKYEVKI